MKLGWLVLFWLLGAAAVAAAPAAENRAGAAGAMTDRSAAAGPTADERARQRYEEMLAKMQSAIEEIAELYGSPSFLEVFTNDRERANDLKSRLAAVGSAAAAQRELADLARRREELLNDLALREKEARRLTDKLARQRAALEALAAAVEQARRATEDSAR
jgi:DNA repair exonuclease SbcCD ATPase subunit